MSDVIRVLQLGNSDWSLHYQLPADAEFCYKEEFTEAPETEYDIVFIDRELSAQEVALLMDVTKAYTLYVVDDITFNEWMEEYYACKNGKRISKTDIQEFLLNEVKYYFPKPYGEKFLMESLSIAQGFTGSVDWSGNYSVTVRGDYGEAFHQIAFWRSNILLEQGQPLDLWLEYDKDPDVEIALSVVQFVRGSVSDIQQKWYFSERDLQDVFRLDAQMPTGRIFVSLLAKGNGMLKIIALHDRFSRAGHGFFIPGGQRMVTSAREEIFYYLNPMDRKPPLNVYFAGYKTKEGFEAYNMMEKLGCPFLLISEPRLSGGSFYMGTEEYEKCVLEVLRKCMDELGFSKDQVILSGISMGSSGALYYGCDILPHAMIVGKPLTSIGDVARNERVNRPGGFPTSLDVLRYLSGDLSQEAIERLNDRFWDKFDATDWGQSKFILSYMIEDDYDNKAYDMLLSHLKADGVQVYGKGIHGRHNDATVAIMNWFVSQFEQILYEDFGRRKNK